MPRSQLPPRVRRAIRAVRCILFDVDGVLTDGKIHLGTGGAEWKAFDLRDGSGIKLAQSAGLRVGFVSGRPSEATTRRARELAVDWLFQGARDKGECVLELRRRAGLSPEQVCFVGDDLLDIPALRQVGFPVAVADAAPEVKAEASYVTKRTGGNGAAREVVELIVRSQKLWQQSLETYWRDASSPRQ